MAFTPPSLATIRAQVTAFLRNRLSDWDLGLESFLGKLGAVFALTTMGLMRWIRAAYNDAVPSRETSTEGLDRWAYAGGIPNNSGGYGRNDAVAASGGAGYCTGVDGTVFPIDSELLASDGVTRIKLTASVTIPTSGGPTGQVLGSFAAITTGVGGNLAIDSVLTWVSPPAGADPTVTLTSALSGGLGAESNPSILQRIWDRWQLPPKGGAAPDYRTWAKAATNSSGALLGIHEAYSYPLRSGTGTADVVVLYAGSGAARVPPAPVISAVDDYLETVRPAAANSVNALGADVSDTALFLTLRTRAVPASATFAWDWSSGTTVYTVDLYAAGPPATIRFPALAPTDLKTAIDNYKAGTGLAPRLQVLATGGSTVPVQARCVDYVDGGGKTTITLENPLPAGWTAPTVGDRIYSGGPLGGGGAVDVAAAQKAYVDSLGPSRASGFADANQPWEDTVAIWRLGQIALDQVDASRVRAVKNLASGGVTIAIGAGSPAATDYTPTDTAGAEPELAVAKHIVCTD